MSAPRLKWLHDESLFSEPKPQKFRQMSETVLLASLRPGEVGALKVRPDGTVMDGHHRLRVLKERGVDIDALPRELVARRADAGESSE